jgi:ribosome-associated protein
VLNDNVKLEAILTWLTEKKADNIRVYDVRNTSDYTDYLVVCEGAADLHNKAIAEHLLGQAKEHKLHIVGKAGLEYGQWVLVDFGDIIAHVFLPEKREYYKIDQLFESLTLPKKEENIQ